MTYDSKWLHIFFYIYRLVWNTFLLFKNKYIANISLFYYVLNNSLSKLYITNIGKKTKVNENTIVSKNKYIVHLKML